MKTWNDAHLKETFCLVEWMGVYLKWWILATFFVDYPQKNHYYLKEKYKWSMIKVMITVLYVLDNYIMLEGSPQIKCVYLFYSCRSYLLPICKTNQNWLELVQLKKTHLKDQSTFDLAVLTIHDSVLSLCCQSSGCGRGHEAVLSHRLPCFWDGLWFYPCLSWYLLFSLTTFYSPPRVYQHPLVSRLLLFLVDQSVF